MKQGMAGTLGRTLIFPSINIIKDNYLKRATVI